ncbi:MAG: hypothetical protein LBS77_04815 [Desulfovibrio sp.]|jgi:hypothetical protein|nr:hypothetical protein [Desulfovibrio sp.]
MNRIQNPLPCCVNPSAPYGDSFPSSDIVPPGFHENITLTADRWKWKLSPKLNHELDADEL